MTNALNAAFANVIVDLAVLGVIAICAIDCWKKGFIHCFFQSISGIAGLLIAMFLAAPLLGWTNGLFGLQDVISDGIIKTFSKIKVLSIDVTSAGIETLLQDTNLPGFLVKALVEAGVEGLPAGTTLAMIAGEKLGEYAATMISFAILFLICKIGLKFLQGVLSSVADSLSLVGKVDSILGLCVGLLKGFLFVSAVLAVFAILPFGSMTDFFQDCIFVRWLYNKNIIHAIFGWFLN